LDGGGAQGEALKMEREEVGGRGATVVKKRRLGETFIDLHRVKKMCRDGGWG